MAGALVHEFLNLAAVFGLLVSIEILWPRERQPMRSRLHGMMFNLIFAPINIGVAVAFFTFWRYLGIRPLVVLDIRGFPLGVIVAAILGDFFFYWMHRAQHRFFWRFHSVHHAIEDMSAINSYHHASEALFRVVFIALPGALFFTLADDAAWLGLLLTLQGSYLHSCTRLHLGPLRYVIGDNRFHRIHHSREPADFNKNFSGFSPLWDLVFGTARFPKANEWPVVGLDDQPETTSVGDWLLRPLRSG